MSTSKKLFISLSFAIALIDTLFVTANYFYAKNTFNATLQDESTNDYSIYQTVLESTYTGLSIQATLFAEDSRIQELFYQGKKALEQEGGGAGGPQTDNIRKQLYKLVAAPWHEASTKFDVRQFQFHLGPGSLSFLRVHQPDKFGDSMDDLRFIIVDTNREQTPRSGFETGRVSSGLRSVVPVFEWDAQLQSKVYVGALEIGTSYKKLLENIDQNINIQLGILLNKQHIKETVWDEFITGQYNNNTVDGCDCILEASSRHNQKALLENISHSIDFEKQLNHADKKVNIISYQNKFYSITFHPLRDYLGTQAPTRADIGSIFIARNISNLYAAYKEEQIFNFIYGILAYLVVEFLLGLTFYNVTKHLTKQVHLQTRVLSEQKNIIELDKLKYKNLADAINSHYFFYTRDKNNKFTYVSPYIYHVLGFTEQEFMDNTIQHISHQEHQDFSFNSPQQKKSNKSYKIEIKNKKGRLQHLLLTETSQENKNENENSRNVQIEGLAQDISANRANDMQLKLRCHILKLITEHKPTKEILNELALGIEAIIHDVNCAIMLNCSNDKTLAIGAVPHLPASFKKILDNVAINSPAHACTIAAYTSKRKLISNLHEFSHKENASELSEHTFFKACCSEPVLSSNAKVLATIDFYYHQMGTPDKIDLSVIATAAELISVLLEE